MEHLEKLSKEELIQLLVAYSKSWLAHDGCWFLSVEKEEGIDTAIKFDLAAWEMFAPIEARRIKKALKLPENGGLKALEKALKYRMYSSINKQSLTWIDDHTFHFRMETCTVQNARRRKGLPDFACKQVGLREFPLFAKEIDPRIESRCLLCPPDEMPDEFFCKWEFTLPPEKDA